MTAFGRGHLCVELGDGRRRFNIEVDFVPSQFPKPSIFSSALGPFLGIRKQQRNRASKVVEFDGV